MKNILTAVVVIASLALATPALSQSLNLDECISSTQVAEYLIANTTPGTEVVYATPYFVVFANPAESTYFQVNFDNNGCAQDGLVISQEQLDALKTGV